jgi:hypothetical protein
VTFKDVLGIALGSSQSGQLVFAYNTFVAIQLALHAVLEGSERLGQQGDDREPASDRNFLAAIG